ncbi:MAG: SpoVR family protein [Clostridia bacterium]|nr:SpoVR family protein [Clostridia bacterium]
MKKEHELELMARAIEDISKVARSFGLDYFDMRFEICPADILYTFGAYGMPTRFSHWSFGKAFHRMKTSYDYNLSRIYELVINSDPCYAFLLEGNSLIQNKLVIAHVYAHCDFFKHNSRFRHTNRQMVDSMASSALRISEYEFKYGRNRVEPFLDAVLALQEHIDPHLNIKQQAEPVKENPPQEVSAYDDLWSLEQKKEQKEEEAPKLRQHPPRPEKDLLYFIMHNAKDLEDWQRDIISIVRDEMLYFWPQIETKIMNEGWASLWHARIIREMDLDEDEAVEFAKMHSGVIQPSTTSINPYYLGLKIWEDIEKRWDNPSKQETEKYGRAGGEGLKKIFEVREAESDSSFLRNYLTEELVEKLDLYLYKKVGHQWQVVEKDWEKVRDGLVANLVNGGFPYITVVDGDYSRHGELCLKHMYEGVELDIRYLEKTLPHVYQLWGRPVHLETVVDGKSCLFSYNGERNLKKIL